MTAGVRTEGLSSNPGRLPRSGARGFETVSRRPWLAGSVRRDPSNSSKLLLCHPQGGRGVSAWASLRTGQR